ncbi:cobyrinate a,c-diamide synthase [Natranaerofaba carboxydovora]|uniref:cobyrinate a,c-diamide synthase n=1 Tax=Natranaerofaba carboxydovora TaxID=2742683 RepID=UPI001F13CF1C|nr:cobyrinate a,c-diamide synthase [Natranaerofaba carboxydovora]UMZ73130.1 Cobyrinate a,c-diamide synthase [Natranaerofaba carboxydovora]
MSKRPRLVIAAPQSGSGKTTVTLAVMKRLVDEGYNVQGFKVGPDYIDTSYYQGITSNPGRNLDSWMTSKYMVKEFFQEGSEKADISVIEGVMGLFDGYSGKDDRGSTAQIAKELNAPVILVVDAKSQARSVAALLHGFYHFDPDVDLKGVIFNKVGSDRHFTYLKEALSSTDLPIGIIGYFPREENLVLPERHLGLVPFLEQNESKEINTFMDSLSNISNKYLDSEKLVKLAYSAPEWEQIQPNFFVKRGSGNTDKNNPSIANDKKNVVTVAYDKAFSFYYQENLEWLEKQGLNLVYVSPLRDEKLPENTKSLYIGGGFPELFTKELSENKNFIDSVRQLAESGAPILAECGGLMYLCEELENIEGDSYELVGLVPAKIQMKDKLKALGYREGKSKVNNFFLNKDEAVRGHEFRYSEMVAKDEESFPWAYELSGRFGTRKEGYSKENILASYLHVHLGSNPEAGLNWVESIKKN